jgi:HSP20 family molecular chaperone IbpA
MAHSAGAPAEKIEQRPAVAPSVDVFENENELLVVADVPGAKKEDVHVHLERGQLSIETRRGEAPGRPPAAAAALLAQEFAPRDYRRVFAVPQGVDASKIEAELDHGVLRLRLPKSDHLRPRRIEVKAG